MNAITTYTSNDFSSRYNVKRTTTDLDVPYYVKETFANDFQGNLRRMESAIEEEYITNLRNECYKQRNYKVSQSVNQIQNQVY